MNELGTEGSIKGALEACGHELKVGLVSKAVCHSIYTQSQR